MNYSNTQEIYHVEGNKYEYMYYTDLKTGKIFVEEDKNMTTNNMPVFNTMDFSNPSYKPQSYTFDWSNNTAKELEEAKSKLNKLEEKYEELKELADGVVQASIRFGVGNDNVSGIIHEMSKVL